MNNMQCFVLMNLSSSDKILAKILHRGGACLAFWIVYEKLEILIPLGMSAVLFGAAPQLDGMTH